jgi:hypothetical protein
MNQREIGPLWACTSIHRAGFGEDAMMTKKEDECMNLAGLGTH